MKSPFTSSLVVVLSATAFVGSAVVAGRVSAATHADGVQAQPSLPPVSVPDGASGLAAHWTLVPDGKGGFVEVGGKLLLVPNDPTVLDQRYLDRLPKHDQTALGDSVTANTASVWELVPLYMQAKMYMTLDRADPSLRDFCSTDSLQSATCAVGG